MPKISTQTALVAADVVLDDLIPIVDTSANLLKHIRADNLRRALFAGTGMTASDPIVCGTINASGAITGNVTGNISGSAATVTGAAQTAITSVGTLSALTVTATIMGSVSGSAATVTSASQTAITTLSNLVTVGALASGSTATGFGALVGTSVTSSGAISGTTLAGSGVDAYSYGAKVASAVGANAVGHGATAALIGNSVSASVFSNWYYGTGSDRAATAGYSPSIVLNLSTGTITFWTTTSVAADAPVVASVALTIATTGTIKFNTYTATTFVASDKYLVVDSAGNVHVSAVGPAS